MCFSSRSIGVDGLPLPDTLSAPTAVANVARQNQTRKKKKKGRDNLRINRNPEATPYSTAGGEKTRTSKSGLNIMA